MDQRNHSNGNGFSVFLTGVIVGVLLTLLFTTRRGKKLLDKITDEGLTSLSDLKTLMQDEDLEEMEDEQEALDDEPIEEEEESMPMKNHKKPSSVKKIAATTRRFFKRPQRRN